MIDELTVNSLGIILYRTGDGVTVPYHRVSLVPGADLTGQPDEVVALAAQTWTPEVCAAYQAATSQGF